ncbi:hypothetical protein BLA27_10430 [Brucella cytisi]|uniref:Uncharacterized protein n=1 Tax=Brucella cytisi TaxID=407152 RepID=A0A1J6I795_9HYPH|nr:hypothetical protein BLA27_10430 [Brucella cytisi]
MNNSAVILVDKFRAHLLLKACFRTLPSSATPVSQAAVQWLPDVRKIQPRDRIGSKSIVKAFLAVE